MSASNYRVCFLLFILQFNSWCLAESSTIAPQAASSLLLDIDKAGALVVAVGERGHILYSDDGQHWHQAMVETRSMLTAVFMLNDRTGWAVGHNAVIVKTTDGARTWQRVHHSKDDEAPLLDIFFRDKEQGFAVGAYGLYYTSSDGGNSWTQYDISISNQEVFETELLAPFDLHLNAIAMASEDRLYMAAERGYLLRSDNAGVDWLVLNPPYHGSFFGVRALSDDALIVFGLKGHLYLSKDAGLTWSKIDTATNAMLTDAVILAEQRIALSGMAGTLLISTDNGNSFEPISLAHRRGLSSLIEYREERIIVVGEAGIETVSVD